MRFSAPFALLLLTAAPLPLMAQQAQPPAAQPGEGPEDARLKELFHDSDEAGLRRNPIQAIFRGDLRYADRLGY